MGFFENWQEFSKLAKQQRLSTAAQITFYKLLEKFNESYWADEIVCTDRELMTLTGIRSQKTIMDAKSRLKLSNLIDFRTSKYYGTTYRLVPLVSSSWSDGVGKMTAQPMAQGSAQGTAQSTQPKAYSNTPARKDVKTERQEDIKQQQQTRTRARECEGEKNSGEEGVLSSRQNATDSTEPISDEVRDAWRRYAGEEPNAGACYELFLLERQYGAEKVAEAIRQAWIYKRYGEINLNLVRGQLNGRFQRPKGDSEGEQVKSNSLEWHP